MNDKYFTLRIPLSTRQTLGRLLRWLTPNGGTLILLALFLFAQSVGAIPLPTRNAAPAWPAAPTINYQGRLADSGGAPINDTVAMQFTLYDAATNGSALWGPESHPTVPVSDGLFSVGLGGQTAGGIPTSILSGDVWLEIAVDGETLAPREQLRAVPYAMQASVALTVPDSSITSAQIADNAVGSSEIANGAVTQAKAPTLLQGPGENRILRTGSYVVIGDSTTEFDIPIGYSFPNAHTTFIAVVSGNNQPTGVYVQISSASGLDKGYVRMSTPVSGHIRFNWIAIGN